MSARRRPGALHRAEARVWIAERRSDPRGTDASLLPIAPETSKRRLRFLKCRPIRRNTPRSFCVVELEAGSIIRDVSIHANDSGCWPSLPTRPVLDSGGRQVSNSGHKQYAALLGWRNRTPADAFSARAVGLDPRRAPWRTRRRGDP
jgi:hypothetical protein